MLIEQLETRRMMSAANPLAGATAGTVTPSNANAIVNFNAPPGPTGFSLDLAPGNAPSMLVVPLGAPS